MEAQKKLHILEGDIGVFSYSVHRHAKGHADVNHKRCSWFLVRGNCRTQDLVYVRILKRSRVRQSYTYAYMHVRKPCSIYRIRTRLHHFHSDKEFLILIIAMG